MDNQQTYEQVVSSLNYFNQYSNLILVVITAVYVVLTGWMVAEMRRARKADLAAHIVAALEQYGPVYGKIHVHNAGPGVAYGIEVTISVKPHNQELVRVWQFPAMLPGRSDYFLLPSNTRVGRIPTLEEVSEEYDDLLIETQWFDAFQRRHKKAVTFNLKGYMEGWYNAGHLIPPDEIPVQLQNIRKELAKNAVKVEKLNDILRNLTGTLRTVSATGLTLSHGKEEIEDGAEILPNTSDE